MARALFDVNFLLALAWPNHQFHTTAHTWFHQHRSRGWATCAITQIGFIRLSSNSNYLGSAAKSPEEAGNLLAILTADSHHRFISELPAASQMPEMMRAYGHQQVTDAYLIGLSRLSKAKLVTFDRHLTSLASNKNLVEILVHHP